MIDLFILTNKFIKLMMIFITCHVIMYFSIIAIIPILKKKGISLPTLYRKPYGITLTYLCLGSLLLSTMFLIVIFFIYLYVIYTLYY
jgi:hypothetical protein